MKTAISIPDDVFARRYNIAVRRTTLTIPDETYWKAERIRQTLGQSRSRYYVDAMLSYLARYEEEGTGESVAGGLAPASESESSAG